jgi:hypothetical protein
LPDIGVPPQHQLADLGYLGLGLPSLLTVHKLCNAEIRQGERTDLQHRSDTTRLDGRGSAYLLRRLAREAPDILNRYEGGEFKSAAAAARAANFKVGSTELQKLRRAWKRAEERAIFRAEIGDA